MGERENNRRAMENVTKRLVDHSARQGKPMSEGEARKIAGESARIGDMKRAEGDAKRRWRK